MTLLRRIAVTAGLLALPSVLMAQDAPKTHTVKKGDTLWDIAKLYFNDPFLWPEIYRVNTDVVEDPHWIYPGEVLRIPDVAALRAQTRDEVAATQPPRRDEPPPPPPPRRFQETPLVVAPRTAVRAGEYVGAPFVAPNGGPPGSGRLVSPADRQTMVTNPAGKALNQYENVIIETPAGVRPVKGDRFLVYRLAKRIPGVGQVIEPVGTVQVEEPGTGNKAIASVRDMYHEMHLGYRLMPIDTLVATPDVFPSAIDSPLRTKVLWLQRDPLLPSIGDYVVVGLAAKDGIVTGDQISFVHGRGDGLPDEVLAIGQVHRVTAQGASVLIIHVNNAGTGLGTTGKLTAKMQ